MSTDESARTTQAPAGILPPPGGGGQPDQGAAARTRTWRDLPPTPPVGPIRPMRAAMPRMPRRLGRPAAAGPPVPGADPRITPGQIALAVLGIVALLAVGVGGALWLLDEDEQVADAALPTESEADSPFGQLTPAPSAPQPPAAGPAPEDAPEEVPDPAPDPDPGDQPSTPADPGAPDAGEGDGATPGDSPSGPDPFGDAPGGQDPSGEAPQGGTPPEGLPPQTAPGPQTGPQPGTDDPEDGAVELPRLFTLSQLPRDTAEADTTVTQTTGGGRDAQVVQTTQLEHPTGPVVVRATRGPEAMARYERLRSDEAREVSVRGTPAFVLEGQHLIWLVAGDPPTLLEVDGPATFGTDDLLTIANGLELR